MWTNKFQTALGVIFPPSCLSCADVVESEFGLCGSCWRQTPFISGLVCDACGVPLMGVSDGSVELCDTCLKTPRPWVAGRAALLYQDNARQLVLGLKHGQKTEIARAAGMWMQNAAKGILHADALLVPIPLHWTRLLKRSFNQSAVLANALAKRTGHDVCPDLLLRHKRTVPLDQKSAQERFDVLQNSIRVNSRRALMARNRRIILIDDVMTSGATLTAATEACLAVGSGDVFVLTLARVAKDA